MARARILFIHVEGEGVVEKAFALLNQSGMLPAISEPEQPESEQPEADQPEAETVPVDEAATAEENPRWRDRPVRSTPAPQLTKQVQMLRMVAKHGRIAQEDLVDEMVDAGLASYHKLAYQQFWMAKKAGLVTEELLDGDRTVIVLTDQGKAKACQSSAE